MNPDEINFATEVAQKAAIVGYLIEADPEWFEAEQIQEDLFSEDGANLHPSLTVEEVEARLGSLAVDGLVEHLKHAGKTIGYRRQRA